MEVRSKKGGVKVAKLGTIGGYLICFTQILFYRSTLSIIACRYEGKRVIIGLSLLCLNLRRFYCRNKIAGNSSIVGVSVYLLWIQGFLPPIWSSCTFLGCSVLVCLLQLLVVGCQFSEVDFG